MSKFFINRPIVAMVIAILVVIVGAVTITTLPITQFPNIAPPEIWLQATYPGADAKTLEDAVATPIEQQVNGVDNMTYMYSLNATANQQTQLMIDFDLKTDPNMDLMLTQSREQLATGQLPPSVNSYGVSVKKAVTAPLMIIDLYSPHGTHDETYLSNYAYINMNDPIARLYGVGQTQVFGAGQYAMRLWVKPDQLAKLGITVADISNAIQAQNTVNPAGQVGGQPAPHDQQFTYAVLAKGRLKSPEEFGNIIVREAPNGGIVRVKDVARVELGTQDYSMLCRLNGKVAGGIAVYQLPGTNAVQTVEGVRKLLAQMKQRFPEDMDYAMALDQTAPVTEGMKEILWTLGIAIVLVILVVCPVLTSRHAETIAPKPLEHREWLCAIGLSSNSERVLRFASQAAAEVNAKLSITHAVPAGDPKLPIEMDLEEQLQSVEQREAIRRIADLQRITGSNFPVRIAVGSVKKALLEVARGADADVLMIGRHPRSGANARIRALTYAIGRHSPLPVLSV
jgi:HAE1 family hydrophobic/amphiphilic exporter-1